MKVWDDPRVAHQRCVEDMAPTEKEAYEAYLLGYHLHWEMAVWKPEDNVPAKRRRLTIAALIDWVAGFLR